MRDATTMWATSESSRHWPSNFDPSPEVSIVVPSFVVQDRNPYWKSPIIKFKPRISALEKENPFETLPFSISGFTPHQYIPQIPSIPKDLVAEGVEGLAIGRLVPSEPETAMQTSTSS